MLQQDLFDRQVEHLLLQRRFQEANKLLVERASSRHRGLLRSLFSKDLSVGEEVRREVTRYTQELYEIGRSAKKDYIGAELDFQENSLRKSVGRFYTVQSVSRRDLSEAVLKTPLKFGSYSDMKKEFANVGSAELQRLRQIIRQGIADGDDFDKILAKVGKTTSLSENQAKTLVSTHLSHAEGLAIEKVVNANSAIYKGYVFTAILDTKTSKTCSGKDGLFQPFDNVTYRPPLHWNCRSSLVPVLRSKRELLDSDSPFLDKSALETIPDGALLGELPLKESFSEWLRRQNHQTKLKYLSTDERIALFEAGAIDLSGFYTGGGAPVSLGKLRMLDMQRTSSGPHESYIDKELDPLRLSATTPNQLLNNPRQQELLRDVFINDSVNASSPLSLTDLRGTTIAGKRSVRHRANNVYDERNSTFDPFTGEVKSTLYYDPDFTLLQERLDYAKESKVLTRPQKEWIEKFVNDFDDRLSTNQKTVVVENLRLIFERYNLNPKVKWENLTALVRSELPYSVVNTSRLLDRRSRARSELFLGFKTDPNEPSVYVLGKQIPIKELQDNKREYELFLRDWEANEGRTLARRVYTSRSAPLRSYFVDPVKGEKGSLSDQLKKWILKKIPGYEEAKKLMALEAPAERITDTWVRKFRARWNYLTNYEFLRSSDRRSLVDKYMLSKTLDEDNIRILANISRSIASGISTDYDALAINIGETLYEKWPPFRLIGGPTLQDYHREGSRILTYFKDQGLIRVQSRGVVRRAAVDLDTGRPSGNWKDTVSREIEVLDPSMLKLQDYNRRLELSNRFGIAHDKNRYYVVPGKKTYFNAFGEDTGVPIVTRSAFSKFDEKQIDQDFADMLNHTMSSKFAIDSEFADFMDDLARFRDPRGKTEYYDSINGFRKLVIERGDLGFGMMEAIRYYRSTGKPFGAIARIDGRGRVYYNGYLTPTGGEAVRPFIDSAHKTPMNPRGLHQIKIQIGAVLGPATEALTDAGRLAIFKRHEPNLLKLGELMSAKTQRPRRIREFLENELTQEIDRKELAKIARFALEYYRIHQHTGGKFDAKSLASYQSALMGEADASASGLQVIALSTGDYKAALNSNVLPTAAKGRIYDLVAQDTYADPRFQEILKNAGLELTWEDMSKAAKYQNI